MRFLAGFLLLVTGLALAAVFGVGLIDRAANTTRAGSDTVPERARTLHATLRVVDLHSDVLLWNRPLLARASRGHVDEPRLREGRFLLQVFSAANSFPLGANYRRTPHGPDLVDVLAVGNRWPSRSWDSPLERALVQAEILGESVRASEGRLFPVRTREDLRELVAGSPGAIGALLSVEGLHGLHGDVTAVDRLFAAGFRVFAPVHMTDNEVAGSAHGWRKGGLTPFGRRVVARIDSLGGIVDLAHASAATIDDILQMGVRSPVVSHTGVDGTCPGNRNLSDEQLRDIARAGGLVGIGFWEGAVCGQDVAAIARAIRHAADVAGIKHVALGSDFDGSVRTPFDAAGMVQLTGALIDAGFSDDEIRSVTGENALAFLARTLPPAR